LPLGYSVAQLLVREVVFALFSGGIWKDGSLQLRVESGFRVFWVNLPRRPNLTNNAMPTPLAKLAAIAPANNEALASLIAPFKELGEERRSLVREVLQIYVSKDSGKYTELEKRKRLNILINDYVKGAADEEDDE